MFYNSPFVSAVAAGLRHSTVRNAQIVRGLLTQGQFLELKAKGPERAVWTIAAKRQLTDVSKRLVSIDIPVDAPFEERQVANLFRKCNQVPTGLDTAKAAFDLVKEIEVNNGTRAEVARQLAARSELAGILSQARIFARFMLGKAPRLDALKPRLTPGATNTLKRSATVVERLEKPTVTSRLYEALASYKYVTWGPHRPLSPYTPILDWTNTQFEYVWYSRHLHGFGDKIEITDFVKAETVPKTAVIDRFVAKEPSINVAYQVAIADHMYNKWSLRGYSFKRAQDRHRKMLRYGDDVCTIDLSSASDTITMELARLILPADWFDLLCTCRTPYIRYPDGTEEKLKMLASSGNGFNSATQTIIFLSLIVGLQPKVLHFGRTYTFTDVSVYGDDIIVPNWLFEKVQKLLLLFGLQPNSKKSFGGAHPFRESCGADMLYMIDVRSYYVETIPTTPLELIAFLNGFRHRNIDPVTGHWRSDYALSIWRGARNLIPEKYRLYGPAHYGDAVIHSTRAKPTLRYRTKSGSRVIGEVGPGDWQTRWKPGEDVNTADVQIKILSEHVVKDLTYPSLISKFKVAPDNQFKYISYHGLWGAGVRRIVDDNGLPSDILVSDFAHPEHPLRKNARFGYKKCFASDTPVTQINELWVPFFEHPVKGAVADEIIDPDAIYRQFSLQFNRSRRQRLERQSNQLKHVRAQLAATLSAIAESRVRAGAHIEKLIGSLKD